VDALTSNIGHLLGTGLLDAAEERLVARRVSSPALDSGLGLRTMAATDAGYAPLSYHCGSVWPHDTAIVIAGLVRAGLGEQATGLVEGLLAAAVAFDGRLPELWSGEGHPVPYPAACRPQAWSAAAAVVVADALRRTGVPAR
jgi:glycogen debranching enzyme